MGEDLIPLITILAHSYPVSAFNQKNTAQTQAIVKTATTQHPLSSTYKCNFLGADNKQ